MMKARLAVVCLVATCAAIAALWGSTSNASADTFVCPDGYQPVPLIALPPDQQDKDKNANFIACAKGPQGSNAHFNAKDDKQPQYVDDIV